MPKMVAKGGAVARPAAAGASGRDAGPTVAR